MTRYWIKIGVGALLVFAVGMGINHLIKLGKARVRVVFDSDQPLSIPLKFVDFRVDGTRLGQLQRLRLLRSAPKEFTGAELTAVLDSGVNVEQLGTCQLRIDNLENVDEHTTFVCVHPDSPPSPVAFEPFGHVTIQGTDLVLTLLLPSQAVQQLRNLGDSVVFADSVTVVEGVPPIGATPGTPAVPAPPAPGKTSVTP